MGAFENKWHRPAAAGQWYRSYGNENWEFTAEGFMRARFASINDVSIREADRKFRWDRKEPPRKD